MKRRNVQQAFVGEPNPNQEGLEAEGEGDDALEIEVRGGRLLLTVPADTPDDEVLGKIEYLSGELILENGESLSFEIQGAAVGAQWSAKRRSTEQAAGLSTIDTPGGV
jgi:hypothetical protein